MYVACTPVLMSKITQMKSKLIIFHAAVFAILCLCFTIASCQKKGIRVRNLQETIALSERHYETIKDMSTASVDELIGIINVTEELEDSILSFTSRDTIAADKQIQERIISVSDSLRFHIMRLALSQSRTLADVIYLKTNTIGRQRSCLDLKLHKQAERFFGKLDNNSTFKDAATTIKEYEKLLANDDYWQITSREIFKDFLKREDICFRSMLQFLPTIPQEKLQRFTEETALICNSFYASGDKSFAPVEEITAFMTMRYNRRILQNADACRTHLMNGVKLNKTVAQNYRWMLLQPFFSIDEMSMAALSSGQQQLLHDIAQDMPELFAKLEKYFPKKQETKDKEASETKIIDVITLYILKSHIKSIV